MTNQPSAIAFRNEVARQLSAEQLQIVGAWLGLEAMENKSDVVFQLGKTLLNIAELSDRTATEEDGQ